MEFHTFRHPPKPIGKRCWSDEMLNSFGAAVARASSRPCGNCKIPSAACDMEESANAGIRRSKCWTVSFIKPMEYAQSNLFNISPKWMLNKMLNKWSKCWTKSNCSTLPIKPMQMKTFYAEQVPFKTPRKTLLKSWKPWFSRKSGRKYTPENLGNRYLQSKCWTKRNCSRSAPDSRTLIKPVEFNEFS